MVQGIVILSIWGAMILTGVIAHLIKREPNEEDYRGYNL